MSDRPLVALALAFAAGIALASLAGPLVLACLLCLFLLGVGFAITRRPIWGLGVLLLAFALLGAARYYAASWIAPNDISRFAPAVVTVTGTVQSEVEVSRPLPRAGRQVARLTLAVQSLAWEPESESTQRGRLPVSGSVAVRLPLLPHSNPARHIPRYGDTLTIYGRLAQPEGPRNPGVLDYRAYLARRGIYAMLTARRPEDWRRAPSSGGNPALRLAFALRRRILGHAQSAHAPTPAGALNGILLGERADLPGALTDDFERTGTVHILATAGLHVGMVVGLLLSLLRFCRVARRPALTLALLSLLLYAVMAGGRPSVVRAAVVAGVYLLGILLEREPDLPNALALAALILLLINPYHLFDPGFQLSFATVITILLLMPLAEEALRGLRREPNGAWPGGRWARSAAAVLATCFCLAVAAQIGAAPLVAYYYNDLSLVSIPANTLVVPVIALILALGFLAAAFGTLAPLLAFPLDWLLSGLLAYVIGVVEWWAALPYASLPLASPSPWLIAGYYGLVWGLAWRWQARRKEEIAGYASKRL